MFGNALQFIHKLIVQYCESPVSSPITWCLGIIWIIKSIHALYKMKVKTDELVAEKEAKEVSEAIKDLDILTEKSKEENQDIRTLMFENLKELKEFYGKRQLQRRLYRLRPPGYNKVPVLRGKSIPAAIRSRDRKIQYTPSITLSYCVWMWSWNSSLVIDRCRSVPFSTR